MNRCFNTFRDKLRCWARGCLYNAHWSGTATAVTQVTAATASDRINMVFAGTRLHSKVSDGSKRGTLMEVWGTCADKELPDASFAGHGFAVPTLPAIASSEWLLARAAPNAAFPASADLGLPLRAAHSSAILLADARNCWMISSDKGFLADGGEDVAA